MYKKLDFLPAVKYFQAFTTTELLLHSATEVAAVPCWASESYGAKPHLPESVLCEKKLIWLWEKRGENISGLAKKWRRSENNIVIWRAQSFQQERIIHV